MRNNQPVVDVQYPLREDQCLISRTDVSGRIVYTNPSFVEVSGFTQEELIGAPHNLVRHPDMPEEAFTDLWHTLKAGGTWTGLVKNRRKDGQYYWVLSTVSPVIEQGRVTGYGAVRVKPDQKQVAWAQKHYAQMRAGSWKGYKMVHGEIQASGWQGAVAALSWWRMGLGGRLKLLAGGGAAWMGGVGLLGVCGILAGADRPGWLLPVLIAATLVGVVSAGVGWVNANIVSRSLNSVLGFARQIGTGNLTGSLPSDKDSETGRLMFSMEIMRRSLLSIAREVRGVARGIDVGANEIAAGNADLSTRTQQQAASLEETASSMEEFTSTVQQNADNATQASKLAHQALDTAARGGAVVEQAVTRMSGISESSRKITEIIGVIDGIAFQTNILALNAAVEAARAGEQGKGFAVVAGEVRSLAQKSAHAAREIKALIEQSVSEIDSGSALVGQAGATMQEIVTSVRRVTDIMGEIATASGEQSTGIDQVGRAVSQMDEVTQQNAAQVEQAAAAAEALRGQSAQLRETVAVFIVGSRPGA